MEIYIGADLSVERNQVVELPLDREPVGVGVNSIGG
jgi:hypothetical protein